MSKVKSILQRPETVIDDVDCEPWFEQIADFLLNKADFVVNGSPHRFMELEFYYYGKGHKDPFAHRDPVQLHFGRWYFHRTKGVYRGGSFKGLDIAFGDGEAFAGILIRTIQKEDGTPVVGPSLSVDHVLDCNGTDSVKALDEAIGTREVWDTSSPLHIRETDSPKADELYRSARVGLTLKKGKGRDDMALYVMRPYRYVVEPTRISKGKPHLVLGLHQRGTDAETIQKLTGCPKKSVTQYIAEFEAGQSEADFSAYIGADVNTKTLCRMHGTWKKLKGDK